MLPAHCTTQDRHLETGTPHLVEAVSAEVLAAVPAAAAVAGSQAAFLRAVGEHPDTAVLRADAIEHLRAVAWVLASTASWSTLTARPTWPVLMQRTGLSRATVARWLRWLQDRGLLGVVESGTTPRFAPMALAAGAGNRAALYVLCVPADAVDEPEQMVSGADDGTGPVTFGEESETPTPLAFSSEKNPYTGARASTPSTPAAALRTGEKRSNKPRGGRWPRCAVAGSRRDRLDLVERLQAEAPVLRTVSARALRSVLRPWLEGSQLGWTVAELLYAIDHSPDGRAHTFTAAVKIPHRWLAHRMAGWLNEHGQALPAPAVAAAAARATERAATARAGAERRDQLRHIEDEHAFGDLVRAAAADRYPRLVEVVMASQDAVARLLPVAAAEALVRAAVRNLATPAADSGAITAAAIATAVDELLADSDRRST